MIKKDDDLIIVSKDFTNLRFGYFKSAEILLFYRILLAGKNLKKDNNVIIEDFSIVQKDLEIKAKDLKQEIFAIQDNFLRTKIKYADRNGVGTIALFEGIYNNIKDNTIEAILTSRGKEFLQNLSDGYIRFLFSDVLKFKSKYSRLILPHLMNVSHLKKFIVSKEKLLEIFEIEEKDGYNNLSNFNRVVLKAVENDLKDIFEDFEIEKKKEGRTIKSYIFKWSNNFNFQKDFENEKEKLVIEAEAEAEIELTAEEKIKKFISENIPTLNYKSIEKNIKSRLENGENSEEIIAFIKRNWHRAIDDDKYKSKIGILKKALEDNFELNLTKGEIEKEKNILNGRGIFKKEVKFVKSEWDSPTEAKKKEVTVKEEVKKEVKEIENITYKEYLEVKEKKINLFNTDDNKDTINLSIQKTSFNNYLRLNYNVTLTKSEWEKEIADLAQRFYSNNIKEATEVYKNFFIIIKEEVKEEEVTVADVKKENAETIVETDEEKINKYLEFKEWEEEISKLPSMYDLTEVHYKLFMLHKYMEEKKLCENDEEYNEVQERIWELEDKKDRLNKKLEEEKEKLWNIKFSKQAKERLKNIKTVKTEKLDF